MVQIFNVSGVGTVHYELGIDPRGRKLLAAGEVMQVLYAPEFEGQMPRDSQFFVPEVVAYIPKGQYTVLVRGDVGNGLLKRLGKCKPLHLLKLSEKEGQHILSLARENNGRAHIFRPNLEGRCHVESDEVAAHPTISWLLGEKGITAVSGDSFGIAGMPKSSITIYSQPVVRHIIVGPGYAMLGCGAHARIPSALYHSRPAQK